MDPSTTATVAGRVTLTGAVPKNPSISMTSDSACVRANPGQPVDDAVIVGPEGALENVFVYVKDGLSAYAFDAPTRPVRLEQKGCRFAPHVLGLQVGQPLELANADITLHNVHAVAKVNDEFNLGATPGSVTRRVFTSPEVMVTVKCDVHSWMRSYVGVVAHPYFATTGADGRFEIAGLPPGEYVIEAWHEKFGTRTERVTVGAKESRQIAFGFNAR